ncbi:MAG: hypothetical protein WCH34_09590 [Bacteroidota bacterium]
MSTKVEYIVDNNGVKTSVIVPYDAWEKLNSDFHKLQNKFKVFMSIQKGLDEIKNSKKKGESLQTLSDFLHESNSKSN